MISFKSFITAIHQAVLSANDSLMEKNTELLDKYFVDTSDGDQLQSTLDDALKATKNVTDNKGGITREQLSAATDALEKAQKSLSGDPTGQAVRAQQSGTLSPRSVVVEYPLQTPNGIELTEVHVPLITLVPISFSKVDKAKISASFDMEVVDGELQLHFANPNRRPRRGRNRGKLEISLAPEKSSEGLNLLIEGYENALKQQISQ